MAVHTPVYQAESVRSRAALDAAVLPKYLLGEVEGSGSSEVEFPQKFFHCPY
jgi:hypothetical protein